MSHNQWKVDTNLPDWEKIGADCSASVRAAGFVRVYRETRPDLIGCQEVSAKMADELMLQCAAGDLHYALLWGRDTPILYNPRKFELVDSEFALLPETIPNLEGKFNNHGTKSWNLAVLRIKENGHHLVFCTTHLWWKSGRPEAKNFQPFSAEARAYQLNLVMNKIEAYQKQYQCPAVLVGDLNCGIESLALQSALRRGYQHAHDIAAVTDDSCGLHFCFPSGYENFYSDAPFTSSIDHILLKDVPVDAVRRYARFSPDYYLPLSDHSPALAEIDL